MNERMEVEVGVKAGKLESSVLKESPDGFGNWEKNGRNCFGPWLSQGTRRGMKVISDLFFSSGDKLFFLSNDAVVPIFFFFLSTLMCIGDEF